MCVLMFWCVFQQLFQAISLGYQPLLNEWFERNFTELVAIIQKVVKHEGLYIADVLLLKTKKSINFLFKFQTANNNLIKYACNKFGVSQTCVPLLSDAGCNPLAFFDYNHHKVLAGWLPDHIGFMGLTFWFLLIAHIWDEALCCWGDCDSEADLLPAG